MSSLAFIVVVLSFVFGLISALAGVVGLVWALWFAAKYRDRPRPWAEHQMTSLEPQIHHT